MTKDTTSNRIDTLEAVIAEQQRTIDDLNEMITKQWDELNAMKREVSKLVDQVMDIEQNGVAPTDQKPPHF